MNLHINEMEFLELGLSLQGELVYQSAKNTLKADIDILPKNYTLTSTNESHFKKKGDESNRQRPTIHLSVLTNFSNIELEANTSHIYNLDSFKPYILKLDNKILNEWLFSNVKYDSLKLNNLFFKSKLDKSFLHKLKNTLELDLAIASPNVFLSPNVKPIRASSVLLHMRDGNLLFSLREPMFDTINLDGSSVVLKNLFAPPPQVQIYIASKNAAIDDDLANLLSVYDIPMPLRSKNGKIQVGLGIDITNGTAELNGDISTTKTTLTIGQQNIDAKNIHIKFNKKAKNITLNNAQISMKDSIEGTLKLTYNLKDSILESSFKIKSFAITMKHFGNNAPPPPMPKNATELEKQIIQAIYEDSKKGIDLDVLNIPPNKISEIGLVGNFKDKKTLDIPILGISADFSDGLSLNIKDVALLSQYSPLLRHFGISKGFVNLTSSDYEDFKLKAKISNLAYPLYNKQGQKLSEIELDGVINDARIFIGSANNKLMFIKEKNTNRIIADGFDLNINEIFESSIPILAQINQQSESEKKLSESEMAKLDEFIRFKQRYEREHNLSPYITYFETHNMNLLMGEYQIPTDIINATMRDDMIKADATYGNGVMNVDVAHGRSSIRASNFSDTFLNKIWKKQLFNGGLFNFKGMYENGILQGDIAMQNTTFKDFAVVQNILALLDTIPALITFKKPGLGQNGYEIEKGKVAMRINGKYLALESIDLVGSSIDIEGNGIINLDNGNCDIVLQASTIKTLADIIDKIPLVGYVILGDDGKFSTNIVMTGPLSNPESSVSIAEDVINAPLGIINRIFTLPNRIINKAQDE